MRQFFTFSEAIRAGIPLSPQGRGALKLYGRTCALGAGLEAMGVLPTDKHYSFDDISLEFYTEFLKLYPYTVDRVQCPVNPCCGKEILWLLIVDLNDHHQWTREQIANFVEQHEESIGFLTLIESQPATQTMETPQWAECYSAS